MKVYYEDNYGNTLCFQHAVEAIIGGQNRIITAHVPDISESDMGSSGFLGGVCVECFPDEEVEYGEGE